LGKKRLLVVSQHYYPENFKINDIVAGFVEDGYYVDVLCGLPNYPEGEWFTGYSARGPKYEELDGVKIHRAGEIRRKGNTSVRIFLNYVSWPVTAFFRVMRMKGSYDAVFCYNTSPVIMCFPAIRASKKYRASLTTYVLDIWPENLYGVLNVKSKILRNIAYNVSNWHYNRVDKLIAPSTTLKERLEQRVKNKAISTYVVPQHAEDFFAVPIEDMTLQGKFAGKTIFLFTGNYSPAQNLEGVVRALANAHRKGFRDIHLLLVGSGMSQVSIERTIQEEGAEEIVTLYGRVDARDIPKFTAFAAATIISLSAHADYQLAMPAKVASCMAAGKPIIASMDGEGARAIQEAECGYVAPAGDEERLCACFLKFMKSSQATKEQMGRNAKEFYENHYARAAVIKRLEQIVFGDK